MGELFGPTALGSSHAGDVAAAQGALGAVMAASPLACFEPVLSGLAVWLDQAEHAALSDDDFSVFNTPEGLLASEVVPEGVYVPQVVVSKNVRKARGRFKVGDRGRQQWRDGWRVSLHAHCRGLCVCVWPIPSPVDHQLTHHTQHPYPQTHSRAFATADDNDDDDEPPPAPKTPAPVRGPAAGARGAAAGRGAGGGKGAKDAATRQAELRQKKLQEEAEVSGQEGQKGVVTAASTSVCCFCSVASAVLHMSSPCCP